VELVVYTAGSEEYADAVMDTANIVLAVGGGDVQLPQRRLYRGDCIFDGQRYYKDLCRIDGYDPKRTLLVEDSPHSGLQRDAVLLVRPYEGGADLELMHVLKFIVEQLDHVADADYDVRAAIAQSDLSIDAALKAIGEPPPAELPAS